MTFKLIESFALAASNADLTARGWTSTEGALVVDAEMSDYQCYQIGISDYYVLTHAGLDAASQFVSVSFKWKTGGLSDAGGIVSLLSGAATSWPSGSQCAGLLYTSAGEVQIKSVLGVTRGTSATGIISPNNVHHIEFQAYCSNSGKARVYVDGILALDIAGPHDFWEPSMDKLLFAGNAGVHKIADVVVQMDGSAYPPLLGLHKIHVLLPDADTAQADFTPLSGAGFENIDDPLLAPSDGDTSYISATDVNSASEFTFSDLSESPASIYAVQVTAEARKTEAGTKTATAYIKGTASSDGAEYSPAETYGLHSDIFDTDPDSAVAFTAADVNNLKIGFKITT